MHPAKVVWVAVVAGCYSYSPPPMLTPVPGTHVALVLSDVGRVGMAPSIGAGVGRVEGVLLPSTDSAYRLQVSDVYGINGSHNVWTAETVAVRRDYVANTLERRFSRPRTYLTVVGASAAFVSFVLTRTLFGIGGSGSDNGSGGGGQNQ
jgi:hypothetical protein